MPEPSIHDACRRGDADAVRALIAADPAAVDADDEHGWRPIFHAGLWRQEAIVQLLLEAGADLAAHDGDVLHYAAEVPGNTAIVALLVQYGAPEAHVRPTDDLSRQFLAAVFLADRARVRALLARHPHPATAADGRGDPPIHHAARNGATEIVRLLLEHGADVNARNARGHTVLYCAGGHGHLATLQLLLSAGADCDARFTPDGKTLLDWLAQYPADRRFTPIAEYKHVVLGLLFLKYISDAFEARRDVLKVELADTGIKGRQLEQLLESRDEYTAENVFWVPPESRWSNLQAQARHANIATLIDDAILAIERDNPDKLKNKLPRDYARRGIPHERLGGLIDLVSNIGFKEDRARAADTLGRVYEYFLGKFAAAEGKLGGEFYTPRCVVRLLVEMLEPYEGRVYDPCCGSGGMFVQSERFVAAHGGRRTDISIFGQESNPTTWRLAHMNLAIRGIEANLGQQPADTFLRDVHADLRADFILANPPFNVSDWSGQLLRDDKRWVYGAPPVGNANYAWIQHFIHHLAEPDGRGGGVAGFVMANGSLSSNTSGEGEIRRRIVEADLVDAVVALPPQLFYTTGIPVCLWFLTRDKSGKNLKRGGRKGGRKGETLFIDARKLGTMQTRTLRVLTDGEWDVGDLPPQSDIGRIVYAFRRWRGESAPKWWKAKEHGEWKFKAIPGFCKPAMIEEIGKHGFVLTPGRYVGAEEQHGDGELFAEKFPRLVADLEDCFIAGETLTAIIRQRLKGVIDV